MTTISRTIERRLVKGDLPRTSTHGLRLAMELARHLDEPDAPSHRTVALCSLLSRRVPQYNRIQEAWCSVEMSDKARQRMERTESSIEVYISAIVALLPTAGGKPCLPVFTGDPRGFTVRVKIQGDPSIGNTWGRDGEFGVGAP